MKPGWQGLRGCQAKLAQRGPRATEVILDRRGRRVSRGHPGLRDPKVIRVILVIRAR